MRGRLLASVVGFVAAVGCTSAGSEREIAQPWKAAPPRLVSLGSDDGLGNERSSIPFPPVASVVTPDGRFVAFESMGSNLVREDTSQSHEFQEVFVRDMKKRTTRIGRGTSSSATGAPVRPRESA